MAGRPARISATRTSPTPGRTCDPIRSPSEAAANPPKGDEAGVSSRSYVVKPGFHHAAGTRRTVRGSVAALPRSGGYAESELRDVPSPGATAAPWRRAWPGREASAWEKCNEFLHVRMHLHSLC